MRKILFLLFFNCLAIAVTAQIKLVTDLAVNYSIIPPTTSSAGEIQSAPSSSGFTRYFANTGEIKEEYLSKPGFELSVGLSKDLGKFEVLSGLGFSIIRYNKLSSLSFIKEPQTVYTENGEVIFGSPIGYSDNNLPVLYRDANYLSKLNINNNTETSLYFINLPIKIRYMILKEKVAVSIGLSYAHLLHSKETLYDQKIINSAEINHSLFSSDFGLSYNISGTIWANARFQQGITAIYNSSEAKNRMISIGLNYHLGLLTIE